MKNVIKLLSAVILLASFQLIAFADEAQQTNKKLDSCQNNSCYKKCEPTCGDNGEASCLKACKQGCEC